MSLSAPARPLIPQCSACIRSYAWSASTGTESSPVSMWLQQTRGKKKLLNNSATVMVRLLKNARAYGRTGSVVPVSRGLMRNTWFHRGIAEYVTFSELKKLKLEQMPMERDYEYGMNQIRLAVEATVESPELSEAARAAAQVAAVAKAAEARRVTPERTMELLEIFVPKRLDFYRQPVVEEKENEVEREESQRSASSAASDLMAARMHAAKEREKQEKLNQAHPIYGSVSSHDVLIMIRAALALNDEASRTSLVDDDIFFEGLEDADGAESKRIKKTGDYTVGIRVRGSKDAVKRTIRVIPQVA